MAYDYIASYQDAITPRAYELIRELQEKLKGPKAELERLSKEQDAQIELIETTATEYGRLLRAEVDADNGEDFEGQEDNVNEVFGEVISDAIMHTAYVSNSEWDSTSIDEVNIWVPSTC